MKEKEKDKSMRTPRDPLIYMFSDNMKKKSNMLKIIFKMFTLKVKQGHLIISEEILAMVRY